MVLFRAIGRKPTAKNSWTFSLLSWFLFHFHKIKHHCLLNKNSKLKLYWNTFVLLIDTHSCLLICFSMFSLKLWSGPTCLRRIWQSYLSKIEYKGGWRWVVWRYTLRFVESPKLSFKNTSNKKIKTCSVTGTWIRIFCLLLYSWTTQSTSLFTTKSCEKSRIKLKTNHRVFNITENLQPKNYLCRQS